MKSKLLIFVGAVLLVLGLAQPAGASNPNNSNDASYWTNKGEHPNALCYKHGDSGSNSHGKVKDGAVILNTFNQDWPGDHWELLVVKGGSGNNNDGGDAVYQHPRAGVKYYPPTNPQNGKPFGVSHWIVCKGSTPAVTTTTAAPSTTSIAVTTLPSTTAVTTTVVETTTTEVTTTTGVTTTVGEDSTTTSAEVTTTTGVAATTTTQGVDETTSSTSLPETTQTSEPESTTTTLVGREIVRTGNGNLLVVAGLVCLFLGGLFLTLRRTAS